MRRSSVQRGIRPEEQRRQRLELAGLGLGTVAAGAGLAWAATRLLPRLYLAPGWPGESPRWAPSDKSGVGTALSGDLDSTSLVWFTLWHGTISEVFYPRMDHPCTRDLAVFVTDGRRFASDERCDAEHEVAYLADGVPAYRLANTCKQGRYRIEKVIIAHPYQDAVLQRTRFIPLRGSLDDYRFFAVLNPHLGLRESIGGAGWLDDSKGHELLQAGRGDYAVALACSAPWRARSVGYAGTLSDPGRDAMRHGRLTGRYHSALRGNVKLGGEVDLAACGGEFTLALGFGHVAGESAHRATASLIDDFDALLDDYTRAWQGWQAGLLPLEGVEPGGRDLYRTSTMVLRTHEGKTVPGSAIASLSIPWGQSFGDASKSPGRGGYHMVWPRDLAMIAGGFVAAGAKAEARRILDYVRATQDADGHWPQNMWVDGTAFWSAIQLGETALAILLVDLLHREGALADEELAGYWPMARRAASYIVRRGPSSQEDRWEDAAGFAPFTLAASIAALLVAAEMAERHGEPGPAGFLRETADAWQASIDHWTYAEGTDLARRAGVPGYYLRIAPADHAGRSIKYARDMEFWYRPRGRKFHEPARIVSPDALAYVRFGVRAPEDPRIVDTIKVVDMMTRVETPDGPSWHRYNHDGYGEKTDGRPFDGEQGHGRAWPLLTGERAHVELAAGRREEAARLLHAMERFAGDGGLIPEQVWDTYDIPEHGLYFGRPSGSAMPLAWAHAESIKLRRSLRDGRVFDLPPQPVRRYLVEGVRSPHIPWRLDHRRRSMPPGRTLRLEFTEPAVIRWGADGGPDGQEIPTRDSGLGVHHADLPTEGLPPGSRVRFRISPAEGGRLDRRGLLALKTYSISVGAPGETP